jgi:hypothetical protein
VTEIGRFFAAAGIHQQKDPTFTKQSHLLIDFTASSAMFQKKQPAKKFAFSLGPKKQQDPNVQDSAAKVSTATAVDAGKRDSDQASTNPINKRPKITLDDEEDLLQSAGIPVEKGYSFFDSSLAYTLVLTRNDLSNSRAGGGGGRSVGGVYGRYQSQGCNRES